MESGKVKKNLKRKMKKKRDVIVKADIHKTNEDLDEIEPREETSEEDKQTKNRKRKRKINQDNNASNNGSNTDNSKQDLNEKTKVLSKRQLKKKKLMEKEAEKKEKSDAAAMQKAYSYVFMWKRQRRKWKFQKLQQIWLMHHLLEPYYVRDELFPTVLEYFEGCEGAARKSLVKTALELIHKADLETNEEHKKQILNFDPYRRARQLLQVLVPKDEIAKSPEIKSIFEKISNGSL